LGSLYVLLRSHHGVPSAVTHDFWAAFPEFIAFPVQPPQQAQNQQALHQVSAGQLGAVPGQLPPHLHHQHHMELQHPSAQQRPQRQQQVGQRTPPPLEDNIEAEANGHSNGHLKPAGSSKKRINKAAIGSGHGLMREVEKLLEASDPPIRTISDLQSRLHGQDENTVARLVQHLKALPDRFCMRGERVTLTKFLHRDDVAQILHHAQQAQIG